MSFLEFGIKRCSLLNSDGETDLSRGLETLQVQTGKDSYTVLNGDLGQGLGKWANRLSEQGSVETPAFSKQPGTAFVLDQENNEVPESPPNCKEDQRSGAKSPGLKGSEREVLWLYPDAALAPAQHLWSTARDQPVQLRVVSSGPGSETPMTVMQMFQETVANYGHLPALVYKQQGQWEMLTYKEYYQQCRMAAKSFLKLGLERYHGVGILGFNSQEWFIADIGCIMSGGLAVGIYTTNSPEACQYVANHCEANILVVENHKQLDKILKVKDQLPYLKAIVQYKDELKQKLPNLYTWKEFLQLGGHEPDDILDQIISSQKANECCSLIYTSGTTGNPKGVMLSHDNVTWVANMAGVMTKLKKGEEVIVSYLPLSHVAAQVNDMWVSMRYAATTYFADPDALKGSLINTLREVRPTSFLGVPRVYEKMQEKMKAVGAKSSTMKKWVADWAKSVGLQASYNAMNGDPTVPWGYMLANNLVFKRVRQVLGLDRCKACYTGAAPITKDTLEYFMSLGIPLYELYGMSESTGPHTISWEGAFRITRWGFYIVIKILWTAILQLVLSLVIPILSCGKELLGVCSKLDKPDEDGNGEICFSGRHVFMGYMNMLEKTEEALDPEGWLHSGDLGKHDDDGFLYITGRIKELIITAGGENVPPVPIEDRVKEELPFISNVMLVGDKKKFLSMLLTLKCIADDSGDPTDLLAPETVAFCQQHGVMATRISDITSKKEPAVYEAIQEGIARVNAKATSNAQKIQKWTILQRDFSIGGGELGPTMKLKRPVVHKMYKEEIDKFYME
ncbi:long-chain-fatty-acid-CoA ligase ACSBG2-like [Arapaima gigas]